jgi:hypothetical protein
MADMVSKGRGNTVRGVENYMAKLTDAQVLAIREDGRSGRELGELYGVHQTTIASIKRGKIWAHLHAA